MRRKTRLSKQLGLAEGRPASPCIDLILYFMETYAVKDRLYEIDQFVAKLKAFGIVDSNENLSWLKTLTGKIAL